MLDVLLYILAAVLFVVLFPAMAGILFLFVSMVIMLLIVAIGSVVVFCSMFYDGIRKLLGLLS